jgi:hypothetical protein
MNYDDKLQSDEEECPPTLRSSAFPASAYSIITPIESFRPVSLPVATEMSVWEPNDDDFIMLSSEDEEDDDEITRPY